MSLISSLNEIRGMREVGTHSQIDDDKCGWDINETNKEYMYPITHLMHVYADTDCL